MIRVEDHLGLAKFIACRYRVAGITGLDLEDLVQEAVLGLLRARESFDPELGSWGSYGGMWANQHVGRYIANHGSAVRVPVYLQQRRRAEGRPGRAQCASLDACSGHRHGTIGIDEGRTLLDFIPAPQPENDTGDLPDTTLDQLIEQTPTLSEREARVLRLRARDMTLKEIGGELGGLSRERIRQIESSAIAKVRQAQGIEVDAKAAVPRRRASAGRRRAA